MTTEIGQGVYSDLVSVVNYLATQRDGSAGAFQRLLARALRTIASTPRFFSTVEDVSVGREVRECVIKRFHQRVLFLIEDERILVFAIIHTSRRAGAWHRRLDTTQ